MQRIFIRSIFIFGAAAVGLGLAFAMPAAAGTVHSWQTQEGTLAFTDDVKRIPARYRASVSSRELGGLGDYVRYSGADEKPKTLYAARVQARLSRLRNANGAVALALPSGAGEAAFLVRTSGGDNGVSTQVGFPLADAEQEPIVHEQCADDCRKTASRRDT